MLITSTVFKLGCLFINPLDDCITETCIYVDIEGWEKNSLVVKFLIHFHLDIYRNEINNRARYHDIIVTSTSIFRLAPVPTTLVATQ